MFRHQQYGLYVYDAEARGSYVVVRVPGQETVCTVFGNGDTMTRVLRAVRTQDDPRWGSLFRLSDTLNLMCDEGLAFDDPAVVKVRQDHDTLTRELRPTG